ncbi:hypothetical protein ACWCYY_29020 [Kitasatospora sp. NPDC001664]
MPIVAIQPTFGDSVGRRNARQTLLEDVEFGTDARVATLSDVQYRTLQELHPEGRAPFWGTVSTWDRKLADFTTGTVVLFTGQNKVRAIGEVGTAFRNANFADTLWAPHTKKGSWHNVYSLLSFTEVEIPYEEIWQLPSFKANDVFRSLRILGQAASDEILEGLRIRTTAESRDLSALESAVAEALGTGTQFLPVERLHTPRTSYQQPAATLTAQRIEAMLVHEYLPTIEAPDTTVNRLHTPAGITDIHVTRPGRTEMIEAKRSSTRSFVREALAQLLDYAPHSPEPADRLTGLFPYRPAAPEIALLHHYGIDCVFRVGPGAFEREEAPEQARAHMRSAWTRAVQSGDAAPAAVPEPAVTP